MKRSIIKSALIAAALAAVARACPLPPKASPRRREKPKRQQDQAPAKSAKAKGRRAKVKLVDINSASKAELMKLPGIDDAEADKIIAGRPYLSKAHLVTHNIIPRGIYEQIKGQIIAIQKPACGRTKK